MDFCLPIFDFDFIFTFYCLKIVVESLFEVFKFNFAFTNLFFLRSLCLFQSLLALDKLSLFKLSPLEIKVEHVGSIRDYLNQF